MSNSNHTSSMIEQRERIKFMKNKTVCIVGLGYVGRPLAKAFSKHDYNPIFCISVICE
ncbi:MAG: hypothetical protein KAV25_09310 [Methanophagales archaeon]|nr:hypothetical protein [Methanophagales archaeon]